MHQYSICFYHQIIFHCIHRPYPFIHRWTLGLSTFWLLNESHYYEHSCTNFCAYICLHLSCTYLGMEMLTYIVIYVKSFHELPDYFPKVLQFYNFTSSIGVSISSFTFWSQLRLPSFLFFNLPS